MSRVFVSYVHQDKEVVDRLCEVLKWNGVRVWLDREMLLPGVKWKTAITEAIRSGTFFLSIHSHQREKRDRSYINEELSVAIEEIRLRPSTKPWLIPVRLDDSKIEPRPIGAGETLLDLQICDLSNWESGLTALLRSLGVKSPRVTAMNQNARRRGFVAPGGTPHAAIRALNNIVDKYSGESVSRALLDTVYGENTVGDLIQLNLLEADRRTATVRPLAPKGDLTLALTVAALQTQSFQTAIGVLRDDMNASSVDIGEAVSKELQRGWSPASMKRNGQALKKWIFVLYPNLELPSPGDEAYLYLQGVQKEHLGKGRPTLISGEVLNHISQMKREGLSIPKMAKLLGMNPETIRRFRRRNPERWNDL